MAIERPLRFRRDGPGHRVRIAITGTHHPVVDGRDVYFPEHSVLHGDFERLAVGTEVRFVEREGEQGPQASSVQVVSKPGVRVRESGPVAATAPRGWEEAPTRRVMAIVLRRVNGDYSLMGRASLDDNSQHDTGFKAIAPGTHFVEVHWQRASGPDANNGVLEMWIDGMFAHTFWNLDNSLSAIDFVRLGALSVKAGANGMLAWDEFESRRHDFVGP